MLRRINKFLNSFERDNNTIESAQENLKTQSIMYYDYMKCNAFFKLH